MKPVAIDLFAGLGGWSEGLLLEGYTCIGFDIERHDYGTGGYPGQLVIQDVLTLHGSQFRDAALIVASPPCQKYSYLAMPWSRSTNPKNSLKAKALRRDWETNGPDNRLFDACFRIQREAIEAAGHHIPLIVENVRGAIPWVGRSAWNYGSFHLWGDVPALMPSSMRRKVPGSGLAVRGEKKGLSAVGFNVLACRQLKEIQSEERGTKIGGDWFSDPNSTCRRHGSKSSGRKAASAQMAKIPLPPSRWIGRTYYPAQEQTA